MNLRSVCIFGGSGFVGHHLATRFAAEGLRVRIASRHPQRQQDLHVLRNTELFGYDPTSADSVDAALQGFDCVVNLVGILNQSGKSNFRKVHVEWPSLLSAACTRMDIKRLLHMSALGACESHGISLYLRTKGEAENSLHTQCKRDCPVTSFRPSVIFGPDDQFLNRFAKLLHRLPGPFPLACPDARLTPVYIGDVVEAFWRSMNDRNSFDAHYDLCGPNTFTLKQLVEYVRDQIGSRKKIIGLGDGLSRLQARLLGLVPGKPFTMDNYKSLKTEAQCKNNGLQLLGITPTALESVAPAYLSGLNSRHRLNMVRRTLQKSL
ncbi:MAG: complex I NDUFA9 subunit family protein [gamma proteobacterium symbiont of Bathyaustriella thionipta]|nr:complex I NDUFA9 subunit family protein [gamma proteobacterium symbiont of Bathyaustriella thionipta]